MVNTRIFFFELNDDEVYHVFDNYILSGDANFSFDDSEPYNIFDLSETTKKFDFEDQIDLEVFDPEWNDEALMTEDDQYLITEDNIQILY
jgi:hypothetical protein